MQVINIECQIAQAQLRRYLTGEEMPNSVVTDLETHLRHCPECMSEAQVLRESLKGVISSKITGQPVPSEMRSTSARSDATVKHTMPTHAVMQTPADFLAAPDEQFKPAKAPKKSNVKTLLYSLALAAVLVLMSTVFRDPTKLFGPRAASVTKDTPPIATKNETEKATSESTDTLVVETPLVDDSSVEPNTTETSSKTTASATDEPAKTTTPLTTSGLIVADGVDGTKQIKTDPPKKDPAPQPKPQANKKPANNGNGSIKVYPPDK